jgi:uncharacterized protein (TIGR01244 family)
MADFRDVTPDFSVSPQIERGDLAKAKALGFTRIINNRPDGEEPGQPTAAELESEAHALGLEYHHIPVVGRPTLEQIRAIDEAATGDGRTLAFCRSGTRSIIGWAQAELAKGAKTRAQILAAAEAVGYELSALLP